MKVELEVLATEVNFNEEEYLAANPDVAAAVRSGKTESGRTHFDVFGKKERRKIARAGDVAPLRARKMDRLRDKLDLSMPHTRLGIKYDFLTDKLRKEARITDTDNVSSNNYDGTVENLIDETTDLILDCGSGKRSIYYDNVVNFEIANYESTDVLGIGEKLPFLDNSFAGVISVAVLEHVRDPFRCASEIARVLRPGGKLICAVPFLQPEHGYPHHYYNMAPQGLRALFEDKLKIDDHQVNQATLPIWSLCWIIQSWADGLTAETREKFLSLPVGTFAGHVPSEFLNQDWVTGLLQVKNFELASATILFAHKEK